MSSNTQSQNGSITCGLTEGLVQQLNRTLLALKNASQVMVRARSEADYLSGICEVIVRDCGYAKVWIGFAGDDERKRVVPVASLGFADGYLKRLQVTYSKDDRSQDPAGRAVGTGKPSFWRATPNSGAPASCAAEVANGGCACILALPLLGEDKAFGALTIYSRASDGFAEEETKLLLQLADDISYCLSALRLRRIHARSEEALRQSEERYRGLVELSPDAILISRHNRIVFANSAALRLFGAAQPDQLLGRSPWDLVHPDFRPQVQQRLASALDGHPQPLLEERILRLDGVVVDVDVVSSRLLDRSGPAVQSVIRDISARKRAEQERQSAEEALRKANEDLARSNADLEQFAYVASHDLQEPLRAVGGYVRLLQHRYQERLDAKALEYIAGAADGAARMERLITDLLAFSRVGTKGGNLVCCELGQLLGEALQNLQASIRTSQAQVTNGPLPAALVDARQIVQVFQNLISNALKFRGEPPPQVHIAAREEAESWVVSVRDNGIGIEPQYFERIFQIFQRLHTRRQYPGTGIGLAICKKIIERHGGAIWVESQPGQGSTFFFSLPKHSAKNRTSHET